MDPAVGDLWFLGKPRDSSGNAIYIWAFTTCKEFPVPAAPVMIPIGEPGRDARFNFGAFDTPVVDPPMGALLKSLAPDDVQLIPAVADDGTELTILNVLPCVDCIDDSKTIAEKWTPEDGRPDKVGKYHTVARLVLDPSRIDHDIFRVAGWDVALVVSARVADAANLSSIEGLKLRLVTGDDAKAIWD